MWFSKPVQALLVRCMRGSEKCPLVFVCGGPFLANNIFQGGASFVDPFCPLPFRRKVEGLSF